MTSIHEHCPKCKSTQRESIGLEPNYGLPDCWVWKCVGCGITYDGPVPPYDDDFGGIINNLIEL